MTGGWKKLGGWLAVAVLAAGISSCGGASATTAPSSTSNAISVGDDFFQPSATTVAVGTTVTWTWAGSISHNVTFDDGPHSVTQASGTFARAFTTAGTFKYHCTIHGLAMSGTVTVQ